MDVSFSARSPLNLSAKLQISRLRDREITEIAQASVRNPSISSSEDQGVAAR
jgi:hypothetical protein